MFEIDAGFGQTHTVETVDKGNLTASFADRIDATNLSKKTVIAMVVNVVYSTSYSPLLQETKEMDTFFSHDLEILPGKTYVHEHLRSKGSFTMSIPTDANLKAPHVEANVIWVQFADGSTWGDNNNVNVLSVLHKREILEHRLNDLDAAANRSNDQFTKTLAVNSGDPDFESIVDRIRTHEKSESTDAAIRQSVGSWPVHHLNRYSELFSWSTAQR
jgi:hypothetical protein